MWESFCEHLRECGRNGTLFIVALLGFFPVTGLISCLVGSGLHWATWMGMAIFAVSVLRVVFGIDQKTQRLAKPPPLCHEDWRTARAKLLGRRSKR